MLPPVAAYQYLPLSAFGCIARCRETKLLRCSLPKISDPIGRKLQPIPLTCGGVITEVSERICFLQVVGPTSVSWE